jgi:uncharacterized protein (DUF1697 family)
MLRGINVAGHNMIKMEELRLMCNDIGFDNVKTYLQSGNIIFQNPTIDNSTNLSIRIHESIQHKFGFNVPVIVRSSKEMERIIANNPFLKQKGIDPTKLHVTFLSQIPEKDLMKKLEKLPTTNADCYQAASQELYLYCPNGYGRTKLSNTAVEKTLSVIATTRNWNTTKTLSEMVSG